MTLKRSVTREAVTAGTFVDKVPDFDVTSLNPDSWMHVAQPSAGIVFRF